MSRHLDIVFLDVGGVIYDDAVYRGALLRALRELGADFTDGEFADEYEACRRDQSGSFRRRLAERFLGPDPDLRAVEEHAAVWWRYRPEDLYRDVRPCLEALAARYRLGLVANQPSAVREALSRDGVDRFFEVWGVSQDLGLEKPDPGLFARIIEEAGVEPARSVMVGDRLDNDVRPAKAVGMRTVWVLRGEAPEDPTPEQLAEPHAWVPSLAELPEAIERL